MIGFGQQEPIQDKSFMEQEQQSSYYNSNSAQELGKIMLDSSSLIQNIRLRLLGFVQTSPNEYEQIGEKLMNEKGAATIATMLDSHVGKDVYLTKITDRDKVRITRDLWINIVRLLASPENQLSWEITNHTAKWSLIRQIIIDPIYFALSRGVDGVEKGFFADTHQSKTVVAQTNQQGIQRKGFFG